MVERQVTAPRRCRGSHTLAAAAAIGLGVADGLQKTTEEELVVV